MSTATAQHLAPSTYDHQQTCRLCKHTLLVGSMSYDARQVYGLIEHVAKTSLGFGPNAEELASRSGRPLEWVQAQLDELKEQGWLKPPVKGKPGEWRAGVYGHVEALAQAELEARRAKAELTAEQELRRQVGQDRAFAETRYKRLEELEERVRVQHGLIKGLKDANESLGTELQRARTDLAKVGLGPAANPVSAFRGAGEEGD